MDYIKEELKEFLLFVMIIIKINIKIIKKD